MSKVDFPDSSLPPSWVATQTAAQSNLKKQKETGKAGKASSFTELFSKAKTENEQVGDLGAVEPSDELLQNLMDDVHVAGEELKGHPHPEEIKRYKAAVRQFLHYVVENGYTVAERSSGINILKRKKFTLVQVIDRKLEQLAAGILAGQSSQIAILARIDEINGLLIDLTR